MEAHKTHSAAQPLLKRTDVTYRIAFDGATPARIKIVENLKKKEQGMVVVRHVYVRSGEQVATVHASVYADEAVAKAVERSNLLAKQQKAEKPAEA